MCRGIFSVSQEEGSWGISTRNSVLQYFLSATFKAGFRELYSCGLRAPDHKWPIAGNL